MMTLPATLPELTTNRPEVAARHASETTLQAPRDRSKFHQTLHDSSRRESPAPQPERELSSREPSHSTRDASATSTPGSSQTDRPASTDRPDGGRQSTQTEPEGADQVESQGPVQTAQAGRDDAQVVRADHAPTGALHALVELPPVEISVLDAELDGQPTRPGHVNGEAPLDGMTGDARALEAADGQQQPAAPIGGAQLATGNLQATTPERATNAIRAADASSADVTPINTSEHASSTAPIPVDVGTRATSVDQTAGRAPDSAPANAGATISTTVAPPEQAGARAGDSGIDKEPSHRENRSKQSPGSPSAARTPALGRAVQIDHAVRLENATGQQAATPEVGGKPGIAPNPAVPVLGASAPADATSRVAASSLEQADPMTSRVLRGVTAAVNQRGGALTMRLDPPELGRLRIQMTIVQGTVTAQFHAETTQAHDLLQRSLAMLRTSLESQGLTVERLSVHAPQATQHSALRHESSDQQSQSQQQRNDADAGEGESRGRHDESSTRDGSRQSHEFREFTGFDFDFDFDGELQPAGVQTS